MKDTIAQDGPMLMIVGHGKKIFAQNQKIQEQITELRKELATLYETPIGQDPIEEITALLQALVVQSSQLRSEMQAINAKLDALLAERRSGEP